MKITDIRTHLISSPIPSASQVQSGAGRKLARQMCLIEIDTDEGLIGYGSPSGPYSLGVLAGLVEDAVTPHLLGEDPRDVEKLWHKLYFGEISRNVGHRSIGLAVMSGIDIALWDLKGKALNVPIYELLGGKFHQHGVTAYASSIYWDVPPEAAAEEATRWIGNGFRAVKLKVGRAVTRDIENMTAIRGAVGGEVALLIDANQALERIGANALLASAEDTGCYWLEEPLPVDDIEGHRLLREKRHTVRIATGENLYGRWSFTDFVRNNAIDVLQADVSRAGGITEVRKIADLASCHHLTWNPHTFNDIITVAANLHLVTSSPHSAMFEWDITYNALMESLSDWRLGIADGLVQPPEGPGLGISIDMDFVKAHPWEGQPSIGIGQGLDN